MSDVSIVSFNCRGLADAQKRRDLFVYIREKKFQIICLQETHFLEDESDKIRAEWGGEIFCSNNKDRKRGTAVLFNKVPIQIHNLRKDKEGNLLALDLDLFSRKITLVNLYAPNEDDPGFFYHVEQTITELKNTAVIITGDWNLVQDFEKDTKNYLKLNNCRAHRAVLKLKENRGMVDPWRQMNPSTRRFTWFQKTPPKCSRLDFFLVSEDIYPLVRKAEILPGYRSDHSFVLLGIRTIMEDRGPGVWKFNNELLKEEKFVKNIETKIQEQLLIYAGKDVEDIKEYARSGEFSLTEDLLFEIVMNELKNFTIHYCVKRKKERDKEERKLQKDISILQRQLNDSWESDVQIALDEKMSELRVKREKKIKGVMMRSKLRWYTQGEKPTKYFFELEKRNYENKLLSYLETAGGQVNDQEKIREEMKIFYERLYKKRQTETAMYERILGNVIGNSLNEKEREELEGEITLDEATLALLQMKSNKTPGIDGWTVEFFKCFWKFLGPLYVRMINCSYAKRRPFNTLNVGIITPTKAWKTQTTPEELAPHFPFERDVQNRFSVYSESL